METTGISLLLDLHDCKSPALDNQAVLEELVQSALQFAGFEMVDQVSHRFPSRAAVIVCVLRDACATLWARPETGFVSADIYAKIGRASCRERV